MPEPSPSPQRRRLLRQVADLVPDPGRPVLMVVDGADGAGKTWFADDLAVVVESDGRQVVRVSLDAFQHPREHRHALGRTGRTVWSRSYDYRLVWRELLRPWLEGPGMPYRPGWRDVGSDQVLELPTSLVPERGLLIVDGVFGQREELQRAWDLAVWLRATDDTRVRRMAARDGSPADLAHPDQERYLVAQQLYREACDPDLLADVVVDNEDPAAPYLTRPGGFGSEPPSPERGRDVPDGWTRDGGHLVRAVRVPIDRPDLAAEVDQIASRALSPRAGTG